MKLIKPGWSDWSELIKTGLEWVEGIVLLEIISFNRNKCLLKALCLILTAFRRKLLHLEKYKSRNSLLSSGDISLPWHSGKVALDAKLLLKRAKIMTSAQKSKPSSGITRSEMQRDALCPERQRFYKRYHLLVKLSMNPRNAWEAGWKWFKSP